MNKTEPMYDLIRKVKNHETILMTDTHKKVMSHKRLVDKTFPKQINGNRAVYFVREAVNMEKYKKPPSTIDKSGGGQQSPRLTKWK